MISQLRQSGMLDAVKLIQAGYPTRIPYESIHSRYKDIMPPEVGGLPPEQFCEVIAEVCGVGKSEYYLGVNINNAVVQAGVAGALSNLSVDDEIEQLIATRGGIDALVGASAAHVGNVKVQARVVGFGSDCVRLQ